MMVGCDRRVRLCVGGVVRLPGDGAGSGGSGSCGDKEKAAAGVSRQQLSHPNLPSRKEKCDEMRLRPRLF